MGKEGWVWRDGVRHKYITWLHLSNLKKVPKDALNAVEATVAAND